MDPANRLIPPLPSARRGSGQPPPGLHTSLLGSATIAAERSRSGLMAPCDETGAGASPPSLSVPVSGRGRVGALVGRRPGRAGTGLAEAPAFHGASCTAP
jgi:hypothetical protein